MAFCNCQRCNQTFEASRSDAKWCRICKPLVWGEQQAQWEQAHRAERTLAKHPTAHTPTCHRCGASFAAWRSDAKWCPTCKPVIRAEIMKTNLARQAYKCSDCGADISRAGTRCRKCAKALHDQTGEHNPNWKGGTTRNNGYVLVRNKKPDKVHPYQGEHIVIWEQTNGRELPKGWNVHHKNGVKDDNRPNNLVGCSASEHHSFGPTIRREYEEHIRGLEARIRELEAQLAAV